MSSIPAAVFWDMDGTMVDSEPKWGIATYEMSERLGRRLTPELREKTIGGSFANTLRICAEHAGVPDPDYDEQRSILYARMKELLTDLKPNPGIRPLLDQLEMPCVVCTNTERELADPCIDAVGRQYFVGSITGDEVPHAKPAPDMYVAAAEMVGFPPSSCLVFEDSWSGMTAARDAGCQVIGLAEKTPERVVSLIDLHSRLSLDGVNRDDVCGWFDILYHREELR